MKRSLSYIFITVIFLSGWLVFKGSENKLESNREVAIDASNTLVSIGKSEDVQRYGTVITNSSSGSLRLRYYDINQKKALDDWQGYSGFWASIEDVNDREDGLVLSDYVKSNDNSVFRIEGTKEQDDCGYFVDGSCLESIIIKKIEFIR